MLGVARSPGTSCKGCRLASCHRCSRDAPARSLFAPFCHRRYSRAGVHPPFNDRKHDIIDHPSCRARCEVGIVFNRFSLLAFFLYSTRRKKNTTNAFICLLLLKRNTKQKFYSTLYLRKGILFEALIEEGG